MYRVINLTLHGVRAGEMERRGERSAERKKKAKPDEARGSGRSQSKLKVKADLFGFAEHILSRWQKTRLDDALKQERDSFSETDGPAITTTSEKKT